MNINKKIYKILMISIFIIFAFAIDAYCAEDTTSTRMKIISGGTKWTNINVSESYEECEALNSTSSTLGTAALEAHLTTDYDWSIMAIFSVSQYGGATDNKLPNKSTNNNNSGIIGIGANYVQTTSLLNTSTSTSTPYLSRLYDSNGNLKKYVNKIDPKTGEDQNGRIAISYLINGGTLDWLGAGFRIGTVTSCALGTKNGLFGAHIGDYNAGGGTGGPDRVVTFRPVIWN